MRPMHSLFSIVAILSLLFATAAFAEEDSFDSFEDEEAEQVDLSHHTSTFTFSGYAQHSIPMHILKEDLFDINDLTSAGFGLGGEFQVFPMENLSFSVGFSLNGMSLCDDRPNEFVKINNEANFDTGDITPDAFIKTDFFYISSNAYLGSRMIPNSKFNPYVKANLLLSDWALLQGGRGSDAVIWDQKEISGNNLGIGFGFGTEYDLAPNIKLNLSTTWTYVLTGDEIKWAGLQHDENGSFMWTNTHFLDMNIGVVYGF